MKRRVALAVVAAGLASACGMHGPIQDIQPGERPNIETDEAGLWMAMDAVEQNLRSSGRVVEDDQLTGYVQGVFCRIAPGYCQDVRLYVVEIPNFNASMAPNGVMQVWTGALLRLRNEAQLAYLLGHEIGHYEKRHSIKRWRDMRNKLDALVFAKLAIAVGSGLVGAGSIGDVAQQGLNFATNASIAAYSREHEREADRIGFERALKAGYDPWEAAKLWEQLEEEWNAGDAKSRSIFFSTHPGIKERIENLKELAEKVGRDAGMITDGQYGLVVATADNRAEWLQSEIRKRKYEQTKVLLDSLIESGVATGQLYYFKGEVYRRINTDEDDQTAATLFEKAIEMGGSPTAVYRALGLTYWDLGQTEKAHAAFNDYLEREPFAGDTEIIKSYMREIRGEAN